jgi:hypothetical protein
MTRTPPSFQLRFPPEEIGKWAASYDYPGEAELISGPVARARAAGYLDFETFMAIGEWKSSRSRKRRASNPPAFVEEVTGLALDPRFTPSCGRLVDSFVWRRVANSVGHSPLLPSRALPDPGLPGAVELVSVSPVIRIWIRVLGGLRLLLSISRGKCEVRYANARPGPLEIFSGSSVMDRGTTTTRAYTPWADVNHVDRSRVP